MLVIGESKAEAKKKGEATDKIYSPETYKTYKKHCRYFMDWLNQEHPEVTTLKKARPYVNEWLQTRVDQGLSAWTISVENQALSKLFGIAGDDPDRFQPPKRNRADINGIIPVCPPKSPKGLSEEKENEGKGML